MRDDELMHFGVLGMKWGIRRYQPYSVKPRKSGKGGKEVGDAKHHMRQNEKEARKKEKAAIKQRRLNKKNALKRRGNLSDEELNRRIERLKREKEFRDLSNEDLNSDRLVNPDLKRIYNDYGKKAVQNIATVAFTSLGLYLVTKAVSKEKVERSEMGDIMKTILNDHLTPKKK